MSAWSVLGLPAPLSDGYEYGAEVDLLRTEFSTAHPRQRLKNSRYAKNYSLSFLLTTEQLHAALGYLQNAGFSWFDLPAGPRGGDISVRLVSDYKVSGVAVGLGTYLLSLNVEER